MIGQWTVLSHSHKNEQYINYWNCRCSCGREFKVRGNSDGTQLNSMACIKCGPGFTTARRLLKTMEVHSESV